MPSRALSMPERAMRLGALGGDRGWHEGGVWGSWLSTLDRVVRRGGVGCGLGSVLVPGICVLQVAKNCILRYEHIALSPA